MATGKITVTLPEELIREMREVAPSRGLSKMVREAMEVYLEQKRKKKLERELIEGYLATNDKMAALTKEWEATDFADWERHVPPYELEEATDGIAISAG